VRPGDELQCKNAKDQHSSVAGLGQQKRISPAYFLSPRRSEEDEQLKAAIATLKKEGLAPKKKERKTATTQIRSPLMTICLWSRKKKMRCQIITMSKITRGVDASRCPVS
jgi:hypothetical protein